MNIFIGGGLGFCMIGICLIVMGIGIQSENNKNEILSDMNSKIVSKINKLAPVFKIDHEQSITIEQLNNGDYFIRSGRQTKGD